MNGHVTHGGQRTGGGRRRVVVGVDGSRGSRTALQQAVVAAARHGADLTVVASYTPEPFRVGGAPIDVPVLADVRDDAERRAQDLLAHVRGDATVATVPGALDVAVDVVVVEGPAARVLVELAAGADLLVVGSRGRGAVRSALLGSVALHCATHADCPVLVAHTDPAAVPGPPRVVVGVDGSAGSRAALAAAVDEAVLRGADIHVVAAFTVSDHWTDMGAVIAPTTVEIQDHLSATTAQLVDAVLGQRPAGSPAPRIRVVVEEGPARDVLVDHGRGAELLVVGSRGHGTLRGLLLGSVGLSFAIRATCPVLVVHPRRTAAGQAAVRRDAALAAS